MLSQFPTKTFPNHYTAVTVCNSLLYIYIYIYIIGCFILVDFQNILELYVYSLILVKSD